MTVAAGPQLASSLTNRIQRIEVSATMAVAAEAEKLRSTGADLVDLGAELRREDDDDPRADQQPEDQPHGQAGIR